MTSKALGSLVNAPLAYVLAQVVFQPMLNLDEKIPQVQEALRTKFPRIDSLRSLGIVIGGLPNVDTMPKSTIWDFTSEDKHDAVRLMQNMLVFHTTAYENYEEFADRFEWAFSTVIDVIGRPFVTRQGLRYIDFLFTNDNKHPDFFVSDGFRSAPELDIKETVEFGFSSSQYGLSEGKLIIKYAWGHERPDLPIELMPNTLAPSDIAKRARASNIDTSGTLDFDRFIELDEAANIKTIISRFKTMHDDLSTTFKKVTTIEALEYWRNGNV